MIDLAELPTATLVARWHALNAALKVPSQNLTGAGVNDKQVDVIDGVILDAQCETHEVLACRPVPSSEEAYALIGVAFEILKDGPRYDEAGERIPLVSCRLPERWGYPLGWLGTEIGGTVYSWGIDVACRLGAGGADVPPRLQKSFVTKDFS